MRNWPNKRSENGICGSTPIRRILKSDQSGRISLSSPFWRSSGVPRVSMLSDLTVGESGILVSLELPESVQNHLMHMGFVPNASVTALRRAPAGDPTVYGVDGMEIALRHETASAIQVRPAGTAVAEDAHEIHDLVEAAQ